MALGTAFALGALALLGIGGTVVVIRLLTRQDVATSVSLSVKEGVSDGVKNALKETVGSFLPTGSPLATGGGSAPSSVLGQVTSTVGTVGNIVGTVGTLVGSLSKLFSGFGGGSASAAPSIGGTFGVGPSETTAGTYSGVGPPDITKWAGFEGSSSSGYTGAGPPDITKFDDFTGTDPFSADWTGG